MIHLDLGEYLRTMWKYTVRNRGWGQRGMWGNRKNCKFSSASGHKHTRENARRRAQMAKGMIKV